MVLALIGTLAMIVAVLFLAYFVTKWIAVHGAPDFTKAKAESGLSVLRQVNVGRSERLLLVRVHERCLLIGVTPASMSVLTELTEEECSACLDGSADPGFADALQSAISRIQRKK